MPGSLSADVFLSVCRGFYFLYPVLCVDKLLHFLHLLQECLGAVSLRVVDDILRLSFLDDHSTIHEDHAVGYAPGKTDLMGYDHHCHLLGSEFL